ncbi:HTH domain-containing protein [Hydrogenispora ethanolica]|jgi:biotin operon repressor|uniref:HTH domain-containing protein n=1 Tax=Hydrogenispora ethanolica TaxID=1082276 RepID=A0A4R1S4R0_HYDET|nr:helix-turn-helix domain-containing protein [Hydrogenispora ethanolica]TCL74201.1 HTH domain-containing protein [Hydrogenispora ethanolica]
MEDLKKKVLNILKANCNGRQNAYTATRLAEHVGISERVVRKVIHELRQERVPVISSPGWPYSGFFLPTSEIEARQSMTHFYTRFQQMHEAIDGIEAGLKDWFSDQEKLELKESA